MPGNSQIQHFTNTGCQFMAPCGGAVWPVNIVENFIGQSGDYDLADGALNFTTAFAVQAQLAYVSFAVDQAITETFTIWLVPLEGAGYETVIFQKNLNNERYVFFDDPQILLRAGDEIQLTCTNNNGVGETFFVVNAVGR